MDETKVFYTNLINQKVLGDKDRLSIFDKMAHILQQRKSELLSDIVRAAIALFRVFDCKSYAEGNRAC